HRVAAGAGHHHRRADRQRLRRSHRELPFGVAAARVRAVHRHLHRAGDRATDAAPAFAPPGDMMDLYLRRRIVNVIAQVAACAAAVLGLLFLGWILWTLAARGLGGIDWALFSQDTPPPMAEGGLRNAFYGSAIMCLLAIAIGTPLGIAAGTWLSEYGVASRIATVVRFVNDILLSAPSIVLGLFVYTLVVQQAGGSFSALAGALSLAFIVLPVVVRTTDE